MSHGRSKRVLALGAGAVALAACTAPGGPDVVREGFSRDAGLGPDSTIAVEKDFSCHPVTSAEPLPARSSVVSVMIGGGGGQSTYFATSELFERFRTVCGGCHVESSFGGFKVTAASFPQKMTADILMKRIETDDETMYMPPKALGGMPYSKRTDTDPLKQLAQLLEIWLSQGSPSGSFTLPPDDSSGTVTSDYLISPTLSAQLTNIGSCVPGKDMVAVNASTMDDLDTFFESATELPDTLAETDLVTLDSDALARNGVISFAPGYPLWSDDSGKMRYVRVPRGESIKFDKQTQKFTIPPNTRFYKTFLRRIIDTDGTEGYRKIETRLIVSRPDHDMPDGTVEQTAIFGSYIWNREETEAVLLKDPLRNGKPFKDRLTSYITDEPKAQEVIDSVPPGGNAEYALEHDHPGLVRHYAIPGSERCIQCHMGSASAAFVLGFTPLQLARHPKGDSGVIEPAMGDELTQLDRLIRYGVISGMTSSADVLPLEMSQGDRKPRNEQELTAQAYMVGNCAHCHNPRGFPSTKSPVLKDDLNLLPGPTGGVFEFPLEKTSRIRYRGENQQVPMPYITPSLRDYPSDPYPTHPMDVTIKVFGCQDPTSCQTNPWIQAPWRSLIYRNVDAPFDYVEDRVVFPHMPRDTPGYDCRVARIMGDWMVSIPSMLKNPDLDENATPIRPKSCSGDCDYLFPANTNRDPQPYKEIKPGDSLYDYAVTAAKVRLDQYHGGLRYTFCPDTSDIVDPNILDQIKRGVDVDPGTGPVFDPQDPTKTIMPNLEIPVRPHWVVTDNTDLAGDWNPRRVDWSTALIDHNVVSGPLTADDLKDLEYVVAALDGVRLTPEVRSELTRQLPFGLWQVKPGCNFNGVRTAGSYTGAERPAWMGVAQPADTAPVYSQSAGAAVFTTICFNCHGVNADSQGLLADAILFMTGGQARVANFRDGLFGPRATPGMNLARVFGTAAAGLGGGTAADDLAARYMAWMSLGGTEKRLPTAILNQVSLAPVLGAYRSAKLELAGTPSMLRLGLKICSQVLPAVPPDVQTLKMSKFFDSGFIDWSSQTGLIDKNGDAEMWMRLCALSNRPVVRAMVGTGVDIAVTTGQSLYWGDTGGYPATAPVMDHLGHVTNGIQPGNYFPLCNKGGPGPTVKTTGEVVPACPAELLVRDPSGLKDKYALATERDFQGALKQVDARKWAARGAINAALSVFLYVQGMETGAIKRQPLFSQCDQLPAAGSP